MKGKKYWLLGGAALLAISLSACSDNKETTPATAKEDVTTEKETKEGQATEQTISYLGENYTLPAEVNNIVAASLESMEDAAILGVKPVGVLAIANEIPTYLANELEGAELIGDKFAPNNEAILALKPDVIIGSSKFQEEVVTQLNKIQTMIPYSHISSNWKDNLKLLGQLSGKESEADSIIADYEKKAAEAKEKIEGSIKDKQILIIRVRQGIMNVYPANVYLNPVLYEDLGAQIPEVISNTKAQAEISLEALAEVNPDYIFLQFETSENSENPTALDELMENPIFQSIEAAKNDHVFVNVVDPLAQGGTAWSKVKFLDAAIESLSKE